MRYTHDNTHRAFYEAVWDLLVAEAGASRDPEEKVRFTEAYTQVEHRADEWRFGGHLGFGGKFWRNAGRFYVSCYREDRTKARDAITTRVNDRIAELQAQYNPNPDGP